MSNKFMNKSYGLSIILLAAGESKRFEGNKMLATIDGKPMYMHMVDKIQEIPASQKVIVTRYQEIIDTLTDNYSKVKAIKNNHSEWGISYSIKLGLEQCISEAYLFAVCDQPWLKVENILKLIDVFSKSEKGIACLAYEGKLGNPVIFDSAYRDELLGLKGDVGGKTIIKHHIDDVSIVEVDDSLELLDIDTKQDYYLSDD